MDMNEGRPKVIYVLGGPGSGKGTQCKSILDNHPDHFYHISTGALLREATQDPSPQHSQIIECMKQGKMVPSRPLVQLIKDKMEKIGNKVTYVLDGFPRNDENLEAWKEIMKDYVDVRFLLYFKCTEDEMRKRLTGRAKTSGRADDNPETIEKRIKIFNDETKKMLERYEKDGGKLIQVDADRSIEPIAADVETLLVRYNLVKPKVIYVLGGPGSGKGTQCKAILDRRPTQFFHISTGALLREATQEPSPQHSQIIECMKQGKMVPSRPLVQLIKDKMEKIGANVTYVLDGFPRNDENLEAWKEIMRDFVDVQFLLYFECSEDEMRKRLTGRAKTSGRADDNAETIEKRIKIFNDQTKKMLERYKSDGGVLISVNADRSIEAVAADVEALLVKHNLVKPNAIYILGGPGSGKAAQCKAILDNSPDKYFHISIGTLLRDADSEPSPQADQIQHCLKMGKMFESKPLIELIRAKIEKTGNAVTYIINGFPRNKENYKAWKDMMKNKVENKFLLYLKCTDAEMRRRLEERGKVSRDPKEYEKTIDKRISIFNDEANQLIEAFTKDGGKVVSVDADQSAQEVIKQVATVL